MMKKHILLLLALLLALAACAADTGETGDTAQPDAGDSGDTIEATDSADTTEDPIEVTWGTLTAEEAKARMDSGDPVTVVDVRTATEYAEGHIEGALLLPNEEIGTTPPSLLPDKDAEILLYCRSGNRTQQAAKKLTAMGYTNVYDFGGIIDWPYETVTGEFVVPDELREPGVLEGFTSEDLDGNPVDDSIFADYPVTMINVWATFCSPCIDEMPDLGALAEEYAPKGLQIIGVVSDVSDYNGGYSQDMVDLAREIVEKTGADYLHLMPSTDLIERKLGEIQAVPTTFFVDEHGAEIGEPLTGARSADEWRSVLDYMLETYGDAS